MRRILWTIAVTAILAAASLTWVGTVRAQKDLSPAEANDLRERIEKLEKQNQELMNILKAKLQTGTQEPGGEIGAPAGPSVSKEEVNKIVADVLKKKDEDKKKADADKKAQEEAEGFQVGKSMGMTAKWNHGVWFESADKAFKIHAGGRVQWDAVWYTAEDNVMFAGPNGTGPIDDAFAPRRARLEIDGTLWEVVDFFCEFDFVNTFNADPTVAANRNNVFNTPVPTDLWATVTNLPWIGNVRVGNQKPQISFEHLTSSRYLNFLERSYAFDAFIGGLDNGFRPGIQMFNWTEDERMTWSLGFYKNNQTVNGWNVGDGEYDVTGRITWLPIHEHDGRCLVHLGIGASHRDVDENSYRVRARTLLRNGPAPLHTPLVNYVIGADTHDIIVPEFAMVWGPFSMQAEYFANWFGGVTFPAGSRAPGAYKSTTYMQSAYVEAHYFLTGEHRPYNYKGGSGAAFGRVLPLRPFYFVEGNEGRSIFSSGAWQVAARYDWIDLAANNVNGGTLHAGTLGLNWFLNPNIKFQWNYSAEHRNMALTENSDGWVHGFGMRMAYDF